MYSRKVEFLAADAEIAYYVVVSIEVPGGYAMVRRFQEEHKVQLAMWPAAGVGARLALSALFERAVLQPPAAVLLQVEDATDALYSVADAAEAPAVAGTVVVAVVVVVAAAAVAAAAVAAAVAADGAAGTVVAAVVVVVAAAAAAAVVVAVAADGAAVAVLAAAVVLLCAAPWDDCLA
jgi:hypothetical protein